MGLRIPAEAEQLIFAAISDPTRRAVLGLLFERERPVHELAGAFHMSRPAISKHLAVLQTAGLVELRKDGRENHYRCVALRLDVVARWLQQYGAFWDDHLTRLGDVVGKSKKRRDHG
jgi:DNA-binding transcriptional ArsR family regulator